MCRACQIPPGVETRWFVNGACRLPFRPRPNHGILTYRAGGFNADGRVVALRLPGFSLFSPHLNPRIKSGGQALSRSGQGTRISPRVGCRLFGLPSVEKGQGEANMAPSDLAPLTDASAFHVTVHSRGGFVNGQAAGQCLRAPFLTWPFSLTK